MVNLHICSIVVNVKVLDGFHIIARFGKMQKTLTNE